MTKPEYPTFESVVVADMKIFEVKKEGDAGQEMVHKKDWECVVGVRPELPEGLEEVITSTKVGETNTLNVKVDEQIFRYAITVKSFTTVNVHTFTPAGRLAEGVRRKDEGNTFYSGQRMSKALGKYELAAKFLEDNNGLSDEKSKTANSKALQAAYTNAAQVYLSTYKWDMVIDRCDKCLAINPENLKGLFRRGCANSALQNWDAARADLVKVLELDDNANAEGSVAHSAQNELTAVEEKIAEREAEKAKAEAEGKVDQQ